MKILVIEDEKEINDSISKNFISSGEIVISANSVFDAEDLLITHQFDIIILDITLPDGNGLELIPIIKKNQDNPGLLILSAKNSLDDKLIGLDQGADDYITKPFFIAELNSRVQALFRRRVNAGREMLSFEEYSLSLKENTAYLNEEILSLTKKEYLLLQFFIINKERVITKEQIAEHLWGDQIEMMDNYDFIYTHIKNLRKKLVAKGGNDYLTTVHGIGYKFSKA